MIIGVVIQVTAIKGQRATAQFIIGRIITGVSILSEAHCYHGPRADRVNKSVAQVCILVCLKREVWQ